MKTLEKRFNVLFLDEALIFLDNMDPKAREKVIYNIHKAQVSLDSSLFKKLSPHIWEFRTLFKHNKYRFLAFWDVRQKQQTLVIITHGFIKKTDKVPNREIDKAEDIYRQYLN